MKLTVLSVAYPFAMVREDTPGGAEQVLLEIDKRLADSGHASYVVASEGSRVKGALLSIPAPSDEIDKDARERVHEACREIIGSALKKWRFDILHFHGMDFASYLPDCGVPALVTLHLPIPWYKAGDFTNCGPYVHFNSVSGAQLASCPPDAEISELIENGIDTGFFRPVTAVRGYVLSLGRICPEKGFHKAMDAARRAGVPFIFAGAVFPYPEHKKYFSDEIKPRLGPGCRFLGTVGRERKRRLLSGAKCLLVPSLAPETSSLVAMEALSCGTPVVAFRSGALSDIVEDNRTGFLVNDSEEMADAISVIGRISRLECRETALRRFSSAVMTGKYLELYRRMFCGQPARKKLLS